MKNGFRQMSPRARAILQLGGVLLGGTLLVGGCSYAIRNSPKVNGYLISRNPSLYLSGVAEYLDANHAESGQYQAELSELVRSANETPGLAETDRLYLFESNATLVDINQATGVCESQVIGRLDENARLEYVLSTVDNTDNRYYLKIVGQMLKNVGEDIYSSIAGLFGK